MWISGLGTFQAMQDLEFMVWGLNVRVERSVLGAQDVGFVDFGPAGFAGAGFGGFWDLALWGLGFEGSRFQASVLVHFRPVGFLVGNSSFGFRAWGLRLRELRTALGVWGLEFGCLGLRALEM